MCTNSFNLCPSLIISFINGAYNRRYYSKQNHHKMWETRVALLADEEIIGNFKQEYAWKNGGPVYQFRIIWWHNKIQIEFLVSIHRLNYLHFVILSFSRLLFVERERDTWERNGEIDRQIECQNGLKFEFDASKACDKVHVKVKNHNYDIDLQLKTNLSMNSWRAKYIQDKGGTKCV